MAPSINNSRWRSMALTDNKKVEKTDV